MDHKIGFVGAGKMVSAIVKSLLNSNSFLLIIFLAAQQMMELLKHYLKKLEFLDLKIFQL